MNIIRRGLILLVLTVMVVLNICTVATAADSTGFVSSSFETSTQLDSSKFTILNIIPDLKKKKVEMLFSSSCSQKVLRDNLKIFPPAQIYWYRSQVINGTVRLRGSFNPGQKYNVVLPPNLSCAGKMYEQTLTSFQMPDLTAKLSWAEPGSVIERDSREMLHVKLTNVEELEIEGVDIPPLLISDVMRNNLQSNDVEMTGVALASYFQAMKFKFSDVESLQPFLSLPVRNQQLFFTGVKRNQEETFSLPLSFRKNKERGAVSLVNVTGKGFEQTAEPMIRLLRLTDIGLTYKVSDRSLLVWATSLHTGQPLADVSLMAVNNEGLVVPIGQTADNGLLKIALGDSYTHFNLKEGTALGDQQSLTRSSVHLLVAATEYDTSYVEFKASGNVKPGWISAPKDVRIGEHLVKGHLFTERGIYRPGDTVHFKGTVRAFLNNTIAPPPAGMTPKLSIKNAKGEKVFDQEMELSEFGTVADSFVIKPFMPLGTYTLSMHFSSNLTASRTFQVQEFRPPRHFTEVMFSRDEKLDESFVNLQRKQPMLNCEISGKYYAGGPVKHGKVRWKVYYKTSTYNVPGFKKYGFGSFIENQENLLESGESILDEQGQVVVSVPLSSEVLSGIYGVEVVASVVDFDGRAAAEKATFQIRPEYMVGIAGHPDKINAGDQQLLEIVVIDPERKQLKSGTVGVEVLRKDYIYIRKRNVQGRSYWSWEQTWRRQIASQLNIDSGRATFDFDFARGGEYLLKFNYGTQGGEVYTSSTTYSVEGAYYGYAYENRSRNFERLNISPEKNAYKPGDTMRLYVNPHRKLASVLLTLERDDIIEERLVELKPGQKYIDIPVTEAHIPNLYVTMLGTVARGDFPIYNGEYDDQAPTFLFGAANITVKREVRELSVTINDGEQSLRAEPGGEMTLALELKDHDGSAVAGEIALAVVDESVLALTGFSTPKLDGLTKFVSALEVATGENRTDLLTQTPYGKVNNEPLTGGDGLAKRADAPTTKVRKDFRAVAYFNPTIRTDENGKAQVSITLPDSMTTYRVYAVACDKGSHFASMQQDLLVVKDFYLESGLPRFFTRGDRFDFLVSAFNKTDQPGLVDFSVTSESGIELQAGLPQLSLAANDRELLPVSGKATRPGLAKATFTGMFGERTDIIEQKIPVNSGHLLYTDLVYGTLRKQESLSYNLPTETRLLQSAELGDDDIQVTLTLSGSPFLRMAPGLKYLMKYPYGCVEQTSSRVLPLAGLRGLIGQGLLPGMSKEETDKFLISGVDRLFGMQTSDGGFGYWPGYLKAHRWGSIYATTAITFAKQSGLDVDADKLKKAMDYLNTAILDREDKDLTFKTFAAFVLASNQALDDKIFSTLFSKRDEVSRQTALLMVLTAKVGGLLEDDYLKKIAREQLNRPDKWGRDDVFYARYRAPAIALLTIAELMPGGAEASKLASELIGGVGKSGRWSSTSDTGWALVALGRHYQSARFADEQIEVTVQQTGGEKLSVTLGKSDVRSVALDAAQFLQQPAVVMNSNKESDLLYQLSVTYPRLDYAANGYENGFSVQKSINNTDGSKEIKVGDIVKVTVDLSIDARRANYVVLDDPLPAGFVAINSALKTEEGVGNQQTTDDSDGYSWRYWDYEGGFYRFVPNYFEIRDDRVLAFRDRAWGGRYRYEYYARAVCAGEFVVPATKVQLMYQTDIVSYTPKASITILPR